MSADDSAKAAREVAATNRKARRDYTILDTIEAGIELRGTEVKSIRQGKISLAEGYAMLENDEAVLYGVNILPYDHGNVHNHDPVRPRKLLLHKREIRRLMGQTAEKGYTLIPLQVYFKRGRAKVELGLGKGKHHEDRREDLKKRDSDLDARRAIANAQRGR